MESVPTLTSSTQVFKRRILSVDSDLIILNKAHPEFDDLLKIIYGPASYPLPTEIMMNERRSVEVYAQVRGRVNHADHVRIEDIIKNYVIGLRFDNFLSFIGVGEDIRRLMSSEYCAVSERLKTYENCQTKLYQDTNTLSEAGFYYTGHGDTMYTFCCRKKLGDWEKNDDPWIEHARFRPDCYYVLLGKGKRFVEEVLQKYKGPEVNQAKVLAESAKDDPTVEDNVKNDDSTNRNPDIGERQYDKVESSEVCNTNLRICIVCFEHRALVAFSPCQHMIACVTCAISLKKCPMCRVPYSMIINSIEVSMDKPTDGDLSPKGAGSQSFVQPLEFPCQICREKQIETVFLPCKHAHACSDCALKTNTCPVCSLVFCAALQIYLQ